MTLPLVLLLALPAGPARAQEGRVAIGRAGDFNLRVYGFVETDFIQDTTQGFLEEQGNTLVPARTAAAGGADNFAGSRSRSQMSVRNSRLGFALELPEGARPYAAKAVLELDMLGNQASNTNPGATPGTQSERDFFNNPTVRVRHAYADLTRGEWNVKVGQTWSLLGWQPYFFPGEVAIYATPGMAYRRFAQFRATNTRRFGDWTLDAAADAARPSQINSGSPVGHAGLRLASTKRKAANLSGYGTILTPLSVAVSAEAAPVRTAGIGNPTGQAVAFDFLLPILPSRSATERANTLLWGGELMSGRGVGGLEYGGLTFGVPGITATTPNAGTAIDSGVAGLNASGNIELIQFRAFRSHVQYTLPSPAWTVSVGYAQVEGRNLDRFSFTAARAAAIAPKIQYGYAALFYEPIAWLRFGAQWSQTLDTYNDAANRYARNNRAQLSMFFIF